MKLIIKILEFLRIKKKFVLKRSEPQQVAPELQAKINRQERIIEIVNQAFFKAAVDMPDVNLDQVLLDVDYDLEGKQIGFKPICGYSVGEEPRYIFLKVKNEDDVESLEFQKTIKKTIVESLENEKRN